MKWFNELIAYGMGILSFYLFSLFMLNQVQPMILPFVGSIILFAVLYQNKRKNGDSSN